MNSSRQKKCILRSTQRINNTSYIKPRVLFSQNSVNKSQQKYPYQQYNTQQQNQQKSMFYSQLKLETNDRDIPLVTILKFNQNLQLIIINKTQSLQRLFNKRKYAFLGEAFRKLIINRLFYQKKRNHIHQVVNIFNHNLRKNLSFAFFKICINEIKFNVKQKSLVIFKRLITSKIQSFQRDFLKKCQQKKVYRILLQKVQQDEQIINLNHQITKQLCFSQQFIIKCKTLIKLNPNLKLNSLQNQQKKIQFQEFLQNQIKRYDKIRQNVDNYNPNDSTQRKSLSNRKQLPKKQICLYENQIVLLLVRLFISFINSIRKQYQSKILQLNQNVISLQNDQRYKEIQIKLKLKQFQVHSYQSLINQFYSKGDQQLKKFINQYQNQYGNEQFKNKFKTIINIQNSRYNKVYQRIQKQNNKKQVDQYLSRMYQSRLLLIKVITDLLNQPKSHQIIIQKVEQKSIYQNMYGQIIMHLNSLIKISQNQIEIQTFVNLLKKNKSNSTQAIINLANCLINIYKSTKISTSIILKIQRLPIITIKPQKIIHCQIKKQKQTNPIQIKKVLQQRFQLQTRFTQLSLRYKLKQQQLQIKQNQNSIRYQKLLNLQKQLHKITYDYKLSNQINQTLQKNVINLRNQLSTVNKQKILINQEKNKHIQQLNNLKQTINILEHQLQQTKFKLQQQIQIKQQQQILTKNQQKIPIKEQLIHEKVYTKKQYNQMHQSLLVKLEEKQQLIVQKLNQMSQLNQLNKKNKQTLLQEQTQLQQLNFQNKLIRLQFDHIKSQRDNIVLKQKTNHIQIQKLKTQNYQFQKTIILYKQRLQNYKSKQLTLKQSNLKESHLIKELELKIIENKLVHQQYVNKILIKQNQLKQLRIYNHSRIQILQKQHQTQIYQLKNMFKLEYQHLQQNHKQIQENCIQKIKILEFQLQFSHKQLIQTKSVRGISQKQSYQQVNDKILNHEQQNDQQLNHEEVNNDQINDLQQIFQKQLYQYDPKQYQYDPKYQIESLKAYIKTLQEENKKIIKKYQTLKKNILDDNSTTQSLNKINQVYEGKYHQHTIGVLKAENQTLFAQIILLKSKNTQYLNHIAQNFNIHKINSFTHNNQVLMLIRKLKQIENEYIDKQMMVKNLANQLQQSKTLLLSFKQQKTNQLGQVNHLQLKICELEKHFTTQLNQKSIRQQLLVMQIQKLNKQKLDLQFKGYNHDNGQKSRQCQKSRLYQKLINQQNKISQILSIFTQQTMNLCQNLKNLSQNVSLISLIQSFKQLIQNNHQTLKSIYQSLTSNNIIQYVNQLQYLKVMVFNLIKTFSRDIYSKRNFVQSILWSDIQTIINKQSQHHNIQSLYRRIQQFTISKLDDTLSQYKKDLHVKAKQLHYLRQRLNGFVDNQLFEQKMLRNQFDRKKESNQSHNQEFKSKLMQKFTPQHAYKYYTHQPNIIQHTKNLNYLQISQVRSIEKTQQFAVKY